MTESYRGNPKNIGLLDVLLIFKYELNTKTTNTYAYFEPLDERSFQSPRLPFFPFFSFTLLYVRNEPTRSDSHPTDGLHSTSSDCR